MLNAVITSKDKSGNTIQYPIETFDKPLNWLSFRGYPLSFQRLYIQKLKDKYNVNQKKIAEMFGIHSTTFSKYCADPLKIEFDHHRMSVAEKEAFEAFYSKLEEHNKKVAYDGDRAYENGSMNQIRLVETTPSKALDEEPKSNMIQDKPDYLKMPIVLEEDIKGLPTAMDATKMENPNRKKTTLKDLHLKFEGELDMHDIFFTLDRLIDKGAKGSVVIKVEFE